MLKILKASRSIIKISVRQINNSTTCSSSSAMDLKQLVRRLEEYAGLHTAYESDNVGLLVEPSEPLQVKRMLVTNDLTELVLDEAIRRQVQLIVSYHQPIYVPLKRLTQAEWKQRLIVKCIEQRIAVYSPHSTWDSVQGGINDWILQAFNVKKVETVKDTTSPTHPCEYSKNLKINVDFGPSKDRLLSKLGESAGSIRFIGEKEVIGPDSLKRIEIEILASSQGVVDFIDIINSIYTESSDSKVAKGKEVLSTLRIYDLEKPLLKNVGLGRIGYLSESIKISEVVEKVKSHFKMNTVRIALANGKTLDDTVKTICVGAGSGSRLLNNLKADIIVTGEFSHHEILHEVHRGTSVILTDHTNNERGYASVFRQRFLELLGKYNENVEIVLSEIDRDPLQYI